MDNRELAIKVATDIIGCYVKQNFTGTWDLIIPGGVNQVDFVTRKGAWQGVPDYPGDIKAAFMVVNKLVEMGYYVDIGIDEYGAQVQLDRYEDHWKLNNVESTRADTAPKAICLAALKTKECKDE